MRWIGLIAFAIAAVLAGPATASPDLRYGPAADWVQRLPVPPASPNPGGSLQVLLQDRQVSFHQGQTDYYDENVYKVLNAQGLQDLGTLGVVWDPAFADMTINTAQIIRGDQTIDLLAAGHDFRILQRETGLPEATLDGRLTAIEEIHDLRVGDVVVFATSMHARSRLDNALAEDAMVLAHSGVAARIRYRAIWPKTMNIQWRNTKGIDGLHSVDHGDTSELIYDAHEVTRPHPPSGAPGRFTNLGDIELSAYKSWNDISSLFAPLYESATTLADDSPLKDEAARIKASTPSQEGQALAALQLVENQVRYMALELGQGGLTPTPADVTWRQRFGDCKAKTALLMALLNTLGIKAEPVIVDSAGGDGLPDWLPMISVFDHILVRAEIGGKVYWLDGTRTGDHTLTPLKDVPFEYGLPVLASGTGLLRIDKHAAEFPEDEKTTILDLSKGYDKDGAAEIIEVLRGNAALAFEQAISADPKAEAEQNLIRGFNEDYPLFKFDSVTFGYDDKQDLYRIDARGTGRLKWDSDGPGRLAAGLGGKYVPRFAERTALEDSEAPYQLTFPSSTVTTIRIVLPNQGMGFLLDGKDVNVTDAGRHVERTSTVRNGVAEIRLAVQSVAPELSSVQVGLAKTHFNQLATSLTVGLVMSSPAQTASLAPLPPARPLTTAPALTATPVPLPPVRLLPDTPALTNSLVPLPPVRPLPSTPAINLPGFSTIAPARGAINSFANAPPQSAPQVAPPPGVPATLLAYQKSQAGDTLGALNDLNRIIEQDPSNDLAYNYRAQVSYARGDYDHSLSDSTHALALKPTTLAYHGPEAQALLRLKRYSEAINAADEGAKSSPQNKIWLAYVRACSYVGLGLNNEALDAFDAAYAQNTNNASNWGCATAQITDIVSSLSPTVRSAFDASLDARPASPMARLIKGLVLTKQDYQLALLQFNEAVRLGPDWTEARFQRSAANLNLRNYPAALTDLNWLAEKRPTDRRVYTLRGEVYSGQKNHQLAIDDYTKAISLGGATSAVYSNRCRDRAEIKADLQAALEDCDQAVKLAPTIWSSYDSRGLTYLQLGKPAEALADYDASINLNANTAPSHYGRALAKHALGDEAGAKADAEVAFRINRNIASEFATYGLAM